MKKIVMDPNGLNELTRAGLCILNRNMEKEIYGFYPYNKANKR